MRLRAARITAIGRAPGWRLTAHCSDRDTFATVSGIKGLHCSACVPGETVAYLKTHLVQASFR